MAGLYENPTSALERAIDALVFNFKEIKTGNGYDNTIGTVLTEPPEKVTDKVFPVVALIRGRTEVLSTNPDLVNKRIPFTAMVYIQTNNDPTKARLSLLKDIERMLYVNWSMVGEDGIETCRFAGLEGDQPFGMFQNQPQIGFVLGFSILLSQHGNDPTVAS